MQEYELFRQLQGIRLLLDPKPLNQRHFLWLRSGVKETWDLQSSRDKQMVVSVAHPDMVFVSAARQLMVRPIRS